MNPRNFFAELKRRNVMPMDYADDSITFPTSRHENFIERSLR
jgi:hypothetical protein